MSQSDRTQRFIDIGAGKTAPDSSYWWAAFRQTNLFYSGYLAWNDWVGTDFTDDPKWDGDAAYKADSTMQDLDKLYNVSVADILGDTTSEMEYNYLRGKMLQEVGDDSRFTGITGFLTQMGASALSPEVLVGSRQSLKKIAIAQGTRAAVRAGARAGGIWGAAAGAVYLLADYAGKELVSPRDVAMGIITASATGSVLGAAGGMIAGVAQAVKTRQKVRNAKAEKSGVEEDYLGEVVEVPPVALGPEAFAKKGPIGLAVSKVTGTHYSKVDPTKLHPNTWLARQDWSKTLKQTGLYLSTSELPMQDAAGRPLAAAPGGTIEQAVKQGLGIITKDVIKETQRAKKALKKRGIKVSYKELNEAAFAAIWRPSEHDEINKVAQGVRNFAAHLLGKAKKAEEQFGEEISFSPFKLRTAEGGYDWMTVDEVLNGFARFTDAELVLQRRSDFKALMTQILSEAEEAYQLQRLEAARGAPDAQRAEVELREKTREEAEALIAEAEHRLESSAADHGVDDLLDVLEDYQKIAAQADDELTRKMALQRIAEFEAEHADKLTPYRTDTEKARKDLKILQESEGGLESRKARAEEELAALRAELTYKKRTFDQLIKDLDAKEYANSLSASLEAFERIYKRFGARKRKFYTHRMFGTWERYRQMPGTLEEKITQFLREFDETTSVSYKPGEKEADRARLMQILEEAPKVRATVKDERTDAVDAYAEEIGTLRNKIVRQENFIGDHKKRKNRTAKRIADLRVRIDSSEEDAIARAAREGVTFEDGVPNVEIKVADRVDKLTRNLLGESGSVAQATAAHVTRSVFKEIARADAGRVWTLPNGKQVSLNDFLVQSADDVSKRMALGIYNDVTLFERFGWTDPSAPKGPIWQQIEREIEETTQKKLAKAKTDTERAKIEKERKKFRQKARDNLTTLVQRARNLRGQPDNVYSASHQFLKGLRNYSLITMSGNIGFSSVVDLSRLILTYGLGGVWRSLGPALHSGFKLLKMSHENAQAFGAGLDLAQGIFNQRTWDQNLLTHNTTKLGSALDWMAHRAGYINGWNYVNWAMKALNSSIGTVELTRALRLINRQEGTARQREQADIFLKAHGIDTDWQVLIYGDMVDSPGALKEYGKQWLLDTSKMQNQDAADVFGRALVALADNVVLMPNFEQYKWSDASDIGKVFSFFRRHMFSQTVKTLAAYGPMTQHRPISMLVGTTMMLGFGWLNFFVRTWFAGEDARRRAERATEAQQFMLALNYSGLLGAIQPGVDLLHNVQPGWLGGDAGVTYHGARSFPEEIIGAVASAPQRAEQLMRQLDEPERFAHTAVGGLPYMTNPAVALLRNRLFDESRSERKRVYNDGFK